MKIIFQEDDGKLIKEVTLNEAQVAAFATGTGMGDVADWIIHAAQNKARKRMDDIVERSGRGSKYSTVEQKEQVILDLKAEDSRLLMTVAEKAAEEQAKRDAEIAAREAALEDGGIK